MRRQKRNIDGKEKVSRYDEYKQKTKNIKTKKKI